MNSANLGNVANDNKCPAFSKTKYHETLSPLLDRASLKAISEAPPVQSALEKSQELVRVSSGAVCTVAALPSPSKYNSLQKLITKPAKGLINTDSKVVTVGKELRNPQAISDKSQSKSLAKGFSTEVDNPPIPFALEESQSIPQLKVLAAWVVREIKFPKSFDRISFEAQLGDWYPPLPPPGETLRLLRAMDTSQLVITPTMSRRQKRAGLAKWKKSLSDTLKRQSDFTKKLQEAKRQLASRKGEPLAVFGSLKRPGKAVTTTTLKCTENLLSLSTQGILKRNAEILFRSRERAVKERRKERRLVVIPPQKENNAVVPIGGVNLAQVGLEKVPRYHSMCATVLCYLKNPSNQSMVKVRALLDSGAEVSLIEKVAVQRAGISGRDSPLTLNVAGGGQAGKQLQEVAFQLVSMDKSYCSPPMLGYSSAGVATPFQPVNFNPKHHAYLRDLNLAEKFPNNETRPINMLLGEPYYSMLEEDVVRAPENLALPKSSENKVGLGSSRIFQRS